MLDHPWRVFFFSRASWALSQQNPRISDITWLVVHNAKTEIRLAGSVLRERFATITFLISFDRMPDRYQSNMVCYTNIY